MITYITRKPDGHVVAYGREADAAQPDRWIASHWTAHPLLTDGAVHVGHLCADATREELDAVVGAWADGVESHV